MPAVVDLIANHVGGLDVASQNELITALNSGMPTSDISFAGPGKTNAELEAAIAAGITLNIESENELNRINQIAEQNKQKARVAIRINPDFTLKSSGMQMTGGAKPFGIDSDKIPDILAKLADYHIKFSGFQLFAGSQNLNSQTLIDCHNQTFQLLDELCQQCPVEFESINIGGGFGVAYFPHEQALNIQPICDNLLRLTQDYPRFKNKQIIMELGRYLVAEAGYYVCQVIDKKTSHGEIFLITNGGMNHHLANSGNLGQVIRKNFPVEVIQQNTRPGTETVNIAGPLCTPLDIVAHKIELPIAEPGDLIVVKQSGAYGKTASPAQFLSHPEAIELLI
jgi:diaminopimelate decarboxylase